MYCPQCSQQQLSEQMRFCSRCGFPLETVSQLIANGGFLAPAAQADGGKLTPRRKGIRKGAILMIMSAVAVPIVALMTAMKEDFFVLFVPVLLCFAIGLARLLYGLLLEQSTPLADKRTLALAAAAAEQLRAASRFSLPARESVPATNWRQPVNTSEMVQPLSVTENTTRLLADEPEENNHG